MKIRYSKKAIKFLKGLDKNSAERIRTAINGLTKNPPEGDIKTMKGYSDGTKRLRVGSWRVIYRIDSEGEVEILFVMNIGNRGDVYK